MYTIGIDPGCPLTIGVLKDGEPVDFYENDQVAAQLQKTGRKGLSWVNQAPLIANILSEYAETGEDVFVVIEQVSVRPTESLSAGIPFVGSMFLAEGACASLKLRYRLVSPSVWKPKMGIKVSLKNPKEPARVRALQEWPDKAEWFARKKDHNRAEALLLAQYWDIIGSKG